MKRLHLQAVLFFLLPMAAGLLIGVPYVTSGALQRALLEGPTALDRLLWVCLFCAALVPPVWGYRLTVRIARAIAQTTEVARRLAEGDFSRTLAAWSAETSEMGDLERSINATATHLQDRLAELSVEKARLEAILQTMADGVLLLDPRKRIVLVNPAAEGMLGVTSPEMLGRDHLEVTHHFALDEVIDRVLRTGQPDALEIRRATPEEQILECRVALAGEGESETRGALVMLRDVTRSRKLEQMRTEFVSNVTHDLRTPLTSIRGFAETLLEGALEDPETARNFVGIIKREAEHLGGLIEDLLDLSRIESGKMKLRKQPVQIKQVAEETAARLTPKAQQLGVALRMQVPDGLPEVMGDPARLAQVLLNLVDNGLKYTPKGGSVTVTAEEQEDRISVTVADTGVGIPKADLPRIFERFYRVDKARTRSTGGTGLGLSIVKHIVDAHGGAIGVVSDVGKGATFTFTIPKA